MYGLKLFDYDFNICIVAHEQGYTFHPSLIFCGLSEAGSWGQQPVQDSSAALASSSGGILRCLQASNFCISFEDFFFLQLTPYNVIIYKCFQKYELNKKKVELAYTFISYSFSCETVTWESGKRLVGREQKPLIHPGSSIFGQGWKPQTQ